MKNVAGVLAEIIHSFSHAGIAHPNHEANNLLSDLFHCSLTDLLEIKDRALTSEEWIRCQDWVKRRIDGEPLAYIVGEVSFYHCKFLVNPHVLIPRHETEILVDIIANDLKNENLAGKVLWDLCTGSGCIGIALKKQFPLLHVVLSDISPEALIVAKENALRNEVTVDFVEGDLVTPFFGNKADYVVSNPPYISKEEMDALDLSVKDFEPNLALNGGEKGLQFYQRFAEVLPSYLLPGAKVWFEIGYKQGEDIKKIFDSGFWKRKQLQNDWSGHNRFFFLENE